MTNEDYYKQLDAAPSNLFDLALGHENKDERYTEMEEVGRGGTKVIHKVLDLSSGRTVAMATPNENLSKEQIVGFLEEARLNSFLQHPNIIPLV